MNHNCIILDGAKGEFGDNVFIAPNCGFYTAGHPLDYEKSKKKCTRFKTTNKKRQIQIASNFAKIGKENGIVIHSCCEKTFLSEYGLKCNGCMSQEIVEYCYANSNKGLVIENIKKHNENSPFLIGNNEIGDKITEAKQKSWIVSQNEQISFI